MLDDEKGRYKLVCTINNGDPYVFTSGSIKDVDQYIYDGKILNQDELYDKCSNICFEGTGNYKFSIIYKYRGIKEKPILYYDDIEKLKNLNAIDEIVENYFKNSKFNRRFIDKFVNPLLLVKESTIDGYAWDLYRDPMNKTKLEAFLKSYISKLDNEQLNYVVNYSRLRNMYCIMKFLDHEYTNPVIYEEIEYIDNNENFKKR